MEEFVTDYGSTIKSRFTKNTKNDANLHLNIDKDRILGKGLVCNEEGKNGYVDEFEFKISEIGTVTIGDYSGNEALILNARVASLYGSKKVQIVLPRLKNADTALNLLKQMKGQPTGGSRPSAPPPAAQKPAAPEPVVQKPVPEPAAQMPSAPEPAAQRPAPETRRPLNPFGDARQAQKPAEEERSAAPQTGGSNYAGTDPRNSYAGTDSRNSYTGTDSRNSYGGKPGYGASPVKEPRPVADMEPELDLEPDEPIDTGDDSTSDDEFQTRLDKLNVLKDCGLLGEKEFNAKKLELVGQFFDLTDFNQKIQKLVVLKDCGVLSDKEFEANKVDIIKECCNTDTPDLKEYRKSVQKLYFLEMGGIITHEECERNKKALLDDVEFRANDDKDAFIKKLRRLPVLKSSQLITEEEYQQRLERMYELIEIKPDEPVEVLAGKLLKWPILVKEKLITADELKAKRKELIATCLNVQWTTREELEGVIRNLVALRQGGWLTGEDYENRKAALLDKVDTIEDYPFRLSIYMMLPQNGLITGEEYESYRQKCIDDIFQNSGSMAEFKTKVGNLLEMQKAGMISEKEFDDFKMKLVSEL